MPKGKRNPELARRENESDAEYYKRRFEMALENQAKANEAKVARINKRISAKQGQIAKFTADLNALEKERDELVASLSGEASAEPA